MSPPIARPFPRFLADTPQDAKPYGEWEQRLKSAFAEACKEFESDAQAPLDPDTIRFYPERTWGDRTFVPIVASASEVDHEGVPEFYGYVDFARGEQGETSELHAEADFTDVIAADNPDWEIDLNDSVIGQWRGDGGRGGDVTLIWGSPLIRGAIAASAEFGSDVIDQAAINDGRFTLVAIDAVHGFGDDLFLEIKLWDRKLNPLAAESLYESEDAEPEPDSKPEETAG